MRKEIQKLTVEFLLGYQGLQQVFSFQDLHVCLGQLDEGHVRAGDVLWFHVRILSFEALPPVKHDPKM